MSDEDIGEVAEESAGEASEIGQIYLYLLKDKVTFDGALDPEANIQSKSTFKSSDFEVGDASCRFLYFQSVADRSNPSWLEFINERLPEADRVSFSATSTNPNGILFVRLDNKTFAATFGRSAVGCILKGAIVQDFGIRTAMNMCGNEEVRQTKTLSNAITTTYIDRQVNTPSDSFVFGINEAEDLRYISAHMIGNKNITLQGKESLTIKVIGSEKLSWLGLILKCREFIKKYDDTSYSTLFPNYRNFRPAPDDVSNDLDAKLIAELKAKNFSKFQFCIPDFIQDDKYSFSYTNNKSRNNKIYSHIEISQLDSHVKFDGSLAVAKLKARYVFAYSHEDDKILSHPRWSAYDCLVFESDHPNRLRKNPFI
ncbi:DUF6119 family protein [Magnetospirillum sulfuroxidans]|uniref:TIGR04141 family sporadically distributed protein n=1 Tax=Magnetospirillum sulfuroxidans TaxID=611300 RepID=A0ABS5IHA3_9PROT|nr:DUF6119 family protein [Magnetospirillum sulfuroxidans]MBR9973807.1 TIGR04141 family sporadically distributed protein [Magnetospirillum sulfuroxidans]